MHCFPSVFLKHIFSTCFSRCLFKTHFSNVFHIFHNFSKVFELILVFRLAAGNVHHNSGVSIISRDAAYAPGWGRVSAGMARLCWALSGRTELGPELSFYDASDSSRERMSNSKHPPQKVGDWRILLFREPKGYFKQTSMGWFSLFPNWFCGHCGRFLICGFSDFCLVVLRCLLGFVAFGFLTVWHFGFRAFLQYAATIVEKVPH